MSSNGNHTEAIPACSCSCGYDDDETNHIAAENPNINLFVLKLFFESNCKCSSKGSLREKIQAKTSPTDKRTHSNY